MYQILIPTSAADDWKQFLAKKEHWKDGRSAKLLAERWESFKAIGFPPEIAAIFNSPSSPSNLKGLQPLLAIPEHRVSLPGGNCDSQTDVFALAKDSVGDLVSIAVEGKVTESFGPDLGEWQKDLSIKSGKPERLAFIMKTLGLTQSIPDFIRYQLLHRTASAVLEARRFNARTAVMLVHSFCPDHSGFADFQAFTRLFDPNMDVKRNELQLITTVAGVLIYVGWAYNAK